MVALVLHHARMKAAHCAVDKRSVLVAPLIAQMGETRHQTAHAGHTQASLPSRFHRIGQRGDDRINEHRLRYALGFRIARIIIHFENNHAQVYAYLRGGQTNTVQGMHGVAHVLYEFVQLRRIERVNFFGVAQQASIAHAQNFPNGHDAFPFLPTPVAFVGRVLTRRLLSG